MNFNISSQSYWAPTPKKIRKIADSVLAGCLTFAGFSVAADHPTLGIVVAVVGGISKMTSNFFTDEPNN